MSSSKKHTPKSRREIIEMRRSFEFVERTRKHFSFLEHDLNFEVISTYNYDGIYPDSVVYDSDRIKIILVHDVPSYEIYLILKDKQDTSNDEIYLPELRKAIISDLKGLPEYFQAESKEDVENSLMQIARIARTNFLDLFRGDEAALKRLKEAVKNYRWKLGRYYDYAGETDEKP